MPFTLGGDWAPKDEGTSAAGEEKPPLKVWKEKRRGSWVTLIKGLSAHPDELKDWAAKLKKSLGCGGTLKDKIIEIQGDKLTLVKEVLLAQGIKI